MKRTMVTQSEMWWSGAVVGDCGYVRVNQRHAGHTGSAHGDRDRLSGPQGSPLITPTKLGNLGPRY